MQAPPWALPEAKCGIAIACYPGYHVTVIRSFRERGTEDVFHGVDSKAARASCPIALWKVAGRKLDYLDSARTLDDLRAPPGNRLEPLAGSRRGHRLEAGAMADGIGDLLVNGFGIELAYLAG